MQRMWEGVYYRSKSCFSEKCFKKNSKERSIRATKEDKSHTTSFSKAE